MKRVLTFIAAVAVALPAWAGVTYEFRSRTDGGAGSLAGTAWIEGQQIRMEISEGDDVIFKDNSVVLSKDSGSTLILLDPREKTYTEFRVEDVFSALGSMMKAAGGMFKMEIANPKVDVRDAGDGGTIEGYATRRYVINSSYDMNMRVMGMSRKMNIQSETETWATDQIGTEFRTFVQQRGLKTGMEDLDRLIDQQASAVKGFPLKQVVKTTTTSGGRPQTSTTTMTITKIRETDVPSSRFEIPAGYTRSEAPVIPGLGQ